ncbi:putative peptidase S49, ClpP/crotonase-like domain-containing protein [Medicago truncatula]|uniref:Putative peptidase S49, ClpP/crotonase-like domain-containing protein n=1 Tax=Medicago truncatula TaxID=3880 RepID=A0A396IJD5_MEDTR|nr:putative peptidase S49, ClpP/crotonase-like domain-containing protein [Medicago truncatula]
MESKTESKVFLSLIEFSENLRKASHDPRVSALFIRIHIDFECRWGMAQEIGVDITNFRKSDKLAIAFVPTTIYRRLYIGCFCNELYLPPPKPENGSGGPSGLESDSGSAQQDLIDYSLYVETEVIAMGKYKQDTPGSAEKIESDDAIVSDVICHWLGKFSSLRGLSLEFLLDFLQSGDQFDLRNWVVAGLITGLCEPDELISSLSRKFGDLVDLKQYSRVRKWTVGLVEGEERIAIIRVSGGINPSYLIPADDNIITKIRQVRSSNTFKALIIRVDSHGGDMYTSDLLWREIRHVSRKIPVICSIYDHGYSGGYMVAMAGNVIVANELSLTGSIGVFLSRANFRNVYALLNNKNKEFFSRGLFAGVHEADH